MEKAWFCETLFFQVVIVMVKDKKRCTIKDTMSIKVLFFTGIALHGQYIYIYIYIYIYMVFTTERFFEAAIENWPEWDLNPRPMNTVQTL